jgi:DNA-directed RNA polymerase beta subunit
MLLKERLLDESDKTTIFVSGRTGAIAVHDHTKNRLYDPLDPSVDAKEIHPVEMSYAFKLLLDEIKSLGIFPRLIMRDKA